MMVPPGAELQKCGLIMRLGNRDTWDAGMIESPAVWQDPSTGRYGMVYTGYDLQNDDIRGYASVGLPRIGLAWSDDLRQWEKDPRNPIFEPSGATGDKGTTGPLIWLENGTYFLFYIGTSEEGYEAGRKTLNLATSTDLTSWKRYENNPIIGPEGEGWRADDIWHASIVKVDAIYYMFFNASGVVDDNHEEFTGYATSNDLMNWAVDDDNSPLIVGSREAGGWDSTRRTGDPSVYRVGDNWYMAYYSWDGSNAQDGLAITTAAEFPLGWKPYDGNPILPIGAAGSIDATHAHKPFIYRTDDTHYHFYTAVDELETRQIALAISPGPCR